MKGSEEYKDRSDQIRLFRILIAGVFVIGLAVWIFQPFVNGTGRTSYRQSCMSNSKQLIIATLIYADDNDGGLPPHFSFDSPKEQDAFVEVLQWYTKQPSMYLCPQAQQVAPISGQEGLAGKMDYVHCVTISGAIPDFDLGKRFLKIAEVKDTLSTPYLRDPIRGFGEDRKQGTAGFLSPHGNGFITSYLDGHAHYKVPLLLLSDW